MPSKNEVAAILAGIRLIEDDERRQADDGSVRITRREFLTDLGTLARAKDGLLTSYVNRATIADEDLEDNESASMIDDADTLLGDMESFDVDVVEEHSIISAPQSPISVMEAEEVDECIRCDKQKIFGINFQRPSKNFSSDHDAEFMPLPMTDESPSENDEPNSPKMKRQGSILQNIIDDFTPNKGDQKILRAIGRTATVNAAVLVTAVTGGAAGAVGYAAGGAITSKRLIDGIAQNDEKEVTKSLAVYGAATGASIAGQAVAGALMIGVAGASLPVAGAVAFGVGCCSGITAGALSEWTVDSVLDKFKNRRDNNVNQRRGKNDSIDGSCADGGIGGIMERCKSDGALLGKGKKNEQSSSISQTQGTDDEPKRRRTWRRTSWTV